MPYSRKKAEATAKNGKERKPTLCIDCKKRKTISYTLRCRHCQTIHNAKEYEGWCNLILHSKW